MDNSEMSRIIGGSEALPGEFPYQVQLRYFDDFFCSGSIISTFLVISAAHCLLYKGPKRVKVTSGENRLNHFDRLRGQVREVRQIILHENYNDTTLENDIAILVLSTPFRFDDFTNSINVPNLNEEKMPNEATVSGWGRTMEKVSGQADNLQKVIVPIVNQTFCQTAYNLIGRRVSNKMLCAGTNNRDSCKADSGGPLTCRNVNGSTFLCGVVSFGLGCGRELFAGIYTNVAQFSSWIISKTTELRANKFCPPEMFRCNNNVCIPKTFVCDLDRDCDDDGLDEENCTSFINSSPCRPSQFRCVSDGSCIPYSSRCDGIETCPDHSDEANCFNEFSSTTPTTTTTATTTTTITSSTRVNMTTRTTRRMRMTTTKLTSPFTSSSTTTMTPSSCPSNFFQCENLRCIPSIFVCDLDDDFFACIKLRILASSYFGSSPQ